MCTFRSYFLGPFAFQPTGSTTTVLIHLLHTITSLLATIQYVIVFALDFSKTFDSVCHSTVLDKYLKLTLPDHIYYWVESLFRGHSQCTKYGNIVSDFQAIMASDIQGSCIGPASYAVTAYNLHPITAGNSMHKYADDSYLTDIRLLH
jgi:hypothetical protein